MNYALYGFLLTISLFFGMLILLEVGRRIQYTIQTNGTKLDDDLCAFFKQHNFLVGLSVDGPKELHDVYRVNKGGEDSFDQVMRSLDNLKKHNVDFNILCTIHAANQDHPLEVYRSASSRLPCLAA